MSFAQGELNFSETEAREPMETEEEEMDEDFDIPAEFQEAMDRLKEVTQKLEGGNLPLEEAMDRYQEGLKLIEFCEDRLEEAELLVEEVEDSQPSPKETDSSSGRDNG